MSSPSIATHRERDLGTPPAFAVFMMTSTSSSKSARPFAVSKPSDVHVEVFVRAVDDADIVEAKWLCTQPALRTVVLEDRYPWHQRVPGDPVDERRAEREEIGWAVGVVGALAMMFGA